MKHILSSLLVVTLLSSIAAPLMAQKDKDPKARAILDAVKEKYQAMKAFKANFTYTVTSPTTGVNDAVEGGIVVKGPRFFLKLPEQQIITDGSTQWSYFKESCEVNVSDYEPDEDEITPNKIYTIYEKDYGYTFVEEVVKGGRAYQVIDLKPKDKDAQFFKIRLTVVKESNSIESWEIFERNANRYLYEVNFFATVTVGDSYFKFNPSQYPCNPEVIDLR